MLTFCRVVRSRGRVVGVAAVDLFYPQLHRFIFSSTGCRLNSTDADSPLCYLFDRSALLTTSFSFYVCQST